MQYKYASQLNVLTLKLTQCPCQAATPRTDVAYRLAWQPAEDAKNFIPRPLVPGVKRRIETNARPLTETEAKKLEDEACDEWAISLHTNPTASRWVMKRYPILGYTDVVEIKLSEQLGTCTPTDHHQHFNLHETAGTDLRAAITQVQPL